MNLYLYLPPASAHSPNVIKGTIYGLISRYFVQNTYRRDYIKFTVLLYRRLLARGWQKEVIYPIFIDAATKIESKPQPQPQPVTTTPTKDTTLDDAIFLHLPYHPNDISRRDLRRLFEEHCGNAFFDELEIKRIIIAYSRLRNIGEYITQAKLHEPADVTSETIMGEYLDGLDPS